MLVVSSKKFRENQKSYLDKIDDGMEILIQRGKNKSYKIVPAEKSDALMSKEAFFAKLGKALAQAESGEGVVCKTHEESVKFLDSL